MVKKCAFRKNRWIKSTVLGVVENQLEKLAKDIAHHFSGFTLVWSDNRTDYSRRYLKCWVIEASHGDVVGVINCSEFFIDRNNSYNLGILPEDLEHNLWEWATK